MTDYIITLINDYLNIIAISAIKQEEIDLLICVTVDTSFSDECKALFYILELIKLRGEECNLTSLYNKLNTLIKCNSCTFTATKPKTPNNWGIGAIVRGSKC